jgi:hypothetical protein
MPGLRISNSLRGSDLPPLSLAKKEFAFSSSLVLLAFTAF